jgi:hypothetical protein
MKFLQTFCVVDELSRLLWVGGDWDDFARDNGGDTIIADQVLSTSLLQYIADERTAATMVSIMDRVLDRQANFHLHYRCDSPAHKRELLMTVMPLRDRRVLITHDLLDVQAMPFRGEWWRHDARAGDMKCSFCCSVRLPTGAWVDPFQSDAAHPATVCYTVCPSCDARLATAFADMTPAPAVETPGQRQNF